MTRRKAYIDGTLHNVIDICFDEKELQITEDFGHMVFVGNNTSVKDIICYIEYLENKINEMSALTMNNK